jgi:hypothetical protein
MRIEMTICANREANDERDSYDNERHDEERELHAPTFALKTPKLIVCPAQFRTSVANRLGSGLSYHDY